MLPWTIALERELEPEMEIEDLLLTVLSSGTITKQVQTPEIFTNDYDPVFMEGIKKGLPVSILSTLSNSRQRHGL